MTDPISHNIETPAGLVAQLARDNAFPAPREPGRCDACGVWSYIGLGPGIFVHVAGHPKEGQTMCMDCIERMSLKGGLDP